jgi:hypothetical protein
MDARSTQETAPSVSQAVRKDFFDRYNGVVVKETVAFGHPTTQRMFRRTFTVAAKNFHFAAVVAPMLLREREDKLAEVERFLRDNLAKARRGFEAELEQVRAIAHDAGISEVGSFSKPSPQDVRLVTPSSTDHLRLFKLADELLLYLDALWIRGEIAGGQRDKGAAQVKRRLRNVALAGRNMYVALCRELRKRKPEEVPAAEAATGTGAEAQPKELVDLEPAAQAIETQELEMA